MSNLSYSNIDRWLFELMEGNLSPEQVAQLESFLIQHPELDVDKDMWELAKVDSQEIVYPHQQKLEKRRPIGLYMSLGFTSIVLLISLGLFNQLNGVENGVQLSVNVNTTNLTNKKSIGFSDFQQFGRTNSNANSTISAKNKNLFVVPNIQNNRNIPQLSGDFIQNSNVGNNAENGNTLNNIGNFNIENGSSFSAVMNNYSEPESNNSGALISQLQTPSIIDKENVLKLPSQEPRQLKSESRETILAVKTNPSSSNGRFASTDYKMSFSSKLNILARNVQRMMDNPVALKNMKDPYYHIPGMQAMDINFGSVGALLATRVQTVSRAQWLGQENQQLMNQISVDGYSYGMRGGLGFQLNHNYYGQGGIENYHASLTYSPKFSVTRNVVVEPSIRLKMGNKSLHSSQIETGSIVEYDRMNAQEFYTNGNTPIGQNLWYKDLGLGLMVNTKWFYIGIQGDNLTEHFDNIYSSDLDNPRRAGKHFIGTIGTDYESKKENITVSPYVVYQQRENLSEAWAGVNLRYHWLTFGGAISSNLEPAASIGLKFDHFMITYNADLIQSQMLGTAHVSHQVTLRFLSKTSRIGQRLLNQ